MLITTSPEIGKPVGCEQRGLRSLGQREPSIAAPGSFFHFAMALNSNFNTPARPVESPIARVTNRPTQPGAMLEFSVIICAHNPRPQYLRRVLEALRSQTLPKQEWELLLIDNLSSIPLMPNWDLS